jgi:hypothetical protein
MISARKLLIPVAYTKLITTYLGAPFSSVPCTFVPGTTFLHTVL